MKKLWWFTSILILFTLLCVQDTNACKKKRKKQLQTSTIQPAQSDTVLVIRAPGVKNRRELDSIKASRVKEKK